MSITPDVAATVEVNALIARYGSLADRGLVTELAELFTEDGRLTIAGQAYDGAAEIVGFFGAMGDRFAAGGPQYRSVRHHLTLIDVDVISPTEATARVYFLAIVGDGLDHWGGYRDRVVRSDSRWRFAERNVLIEGARPGSIAVAFVI